MEFCGCDPVLRQLEAPQRDILQTPDKGVGARASKGWARALRQWLAPNKAVHSWGDGSVRRRQSMAERDKDTGDQGTASSKEDGGQASFGSLPDHLLEGILANLVRGCSRLTHFNVCAVSRSWRQLGRQLFFSSPWSEHRLLCHPAQLFCLSPRPVETSRTGLLKCFVRREARSAMRGARRYHLYMGRDPKQSRKLRFLLCAVQASRCEVLIYLNREAQGTPVGRLTSNGFCTRYSLSLAPGWQLLGAGAEPVAGPPLLHLLPPPQRWASLPLRGLGESGGDSEAAAAAAAAGGEGLQVAPAVLGTLQYKARLRGFMQPRRVEVELPPLSQLSFGRGLPSLCRESSSTPEQLVQQGGEGGGVVGSRSLSHVPSPSLSSSTGGWGSPCQRSHGPPASAAEPPGGCRKQPQQQQAPGPGKGDAAGGSGVLSLRNKQPQWNNELRCWCLNFRGRVKQASVKNFQLIRGADPSERVVFQFGKVERDIYILDFNPTVMTSFQAFCVALSTFDGKVML